MDQNSKTLLNLNQWIWQSFLRVAVIPLLIIELVFVVIYFYANSFSTNLMIDYVSEESKVELQEIASAQANTIQSQLLSITNYTDYFRRQTLNAHQSNATLSESLKSRLTMTDYGAYYTTTDSSEGGVAIFYSGAVYVGEKEKQKLGQLMVLEEEMINLLETEPLVTQIYYNTFDSLNIIYPYFDTITQYPVAMNIPDYNFYYEADSFHNPDRGIEWTGVYLDPAGQGWMASAIAPVYTDDFLEGVVGIDVTVKTFTQTILDMQVPYEGYGILVSEEGTILALPKAGEIDWNLIEYTDHTYDEAVLEDTFKPDAFNLFLAMEDSTDLAKIQAYESGIMDTTVHGEQHTLAWSTIEETGWKLVLIIHPDNLILQINKIEGQLLQLGFIMLGGMVVFYIIFFIFMAKRARQMSYFISEPLSGLNETFTEIGLGNYKVKVNETSVLEIQETQNKVIDMGKKLSDATKALLRSEERFNLALEGANTGLWDYSVLTKETYFSPKMKEILGYKDHELVASLQKWEDMVHPDDRNQLIEMMNEMITGQKANVQLELRLRNKSGEYIWNSIRGGVILDPNNKPVRIVGTNADITELISQRFKTQKLESDLNQRETDINQLKEVSYQDALTGIFNRRYFIDYAQNFDLRENNQSNFCVAMLDLDLFKDVNDSYGHDAGDDLLIRTVKIMKESIRSSDTIIRYGGEEFVIIFEKTTKMGAKRACENIRKNLEAIVDDLIGVQTVSIGLAQLKSNETLESCVKRADTALYQAKNEGRNRVVVSK